MYCHGSALNLGEVSGEHKIEKKVVLIVQGSLQMGHIIVQGTT
jgi:hypothetical protein